MTIDVTVKLVIGRTRAEVARFAMDPANDPTWIGGVVEARLLTNPPLGQGSQVRRVANFLGKRIEYVTEAVDYEPERMLYMRSIEGPFPMTVHYYFDDAGGGTRVEIRNQGAASGFFKLAEPLLARAMKRSVRKDLKTLKRLLEAGASHA